MNGKKQHLQKTHGRGKSEDTHVRRVRWLSASAKETERLGRAFAGTLHGGEIIVLEGELGTGKTTFVRGLARALGIGGAIRSPTFTLLHEYKVKSQTSPPKADPPLAENLKYLIHVDAYRLRSAADLRALGLEEYLGKNDTVVVIEWGKKTILFLRRFRPLTIIFEHGEKPDERIVMIQK